MGRPSIQNSRLVSKVAKKLNKSELDIRKTVSALSHRKKIPLDVALIFYAEGKGIGTGDARRNLDSAKTLILDRILNSPENEKDHPPQKTPKKKVKVPNVNWNRYADPYLFEAVYLNIPSEAYSILFILENSIRGFISRVLSENHGDNWWSDYISGIKSLSKIVTEVERRRHDESENWHHSKRGIHEIYYTDYANLLAIIRSCDVDFSEYFKKVPARNLPGKLEELTPTRNVVAHNNKINKTDLDRLKTHAHDWFSYMQSLYAN